MYFRTYSNNFSIWSNINTATIRVVIIIIATSNGGGLGQHGLAGQQETEQTGQGASQQAARPGGGVWMLMCFVLRHNQQDNIGLILGKGQGGGERILQDEAVRPLIARMSRDSISI